ncbi:hypothetical protein QMA56_05145 [Leuconostoc falkenbergense]|uniref:BOW99_gp33 family protein n=1 Tax=Leuconostoc falkenbergense TaxID=2766470 RepID=UPI0024AE3FCD|nr:hypothetical protein [Leuconostoc falkenbergense]MDI6667095.1 hypothetical protein [Leuconostoc falkenbergense]
MKVTHILKDGTRRDSMKGFVIPVNEDTEHIYQTIARIQMELAEKEAKKNA